MRGMIVYEMFVPFLLGHEEGIWCWTVFQDARVRTQVIRYMFPGIFSMLLMKRNNLLTSIDCFLILMPGLLDSNRDI